MPARFGAGTSALVADRLTPGNPHPGDDAVLRLGAEALRVAGVRPDDLLIATEGAARTDAITCGSSCRVRYVADGPAVAHAEGHIVFALAPLSRSGSQEPGPPARSAVRGSRRRSGRGRGKAWPLIYDAR